MLVHGALKELGNFFAIFARLSEHVTQGLARQVQDHFLQPPTQCAEFAMPLKTPLRSPYSSVKNGIALAERYFSSSSVSLSYAP
jgi:hypothetical protein